MPIAAPIRIVRLLMFAASESRYHVTRVTRNRRSKGDSRSPGAKRVHPPEDARGT
jgi:hypothetical protein